MHSKIKRKTKDSKNSNKLTKKKPKKKSVKGKSVKGKSVKGKSVKGKSVKGKSTKKKRKVNKRKKILLVGLAFSFQKVKKLSTNKYDMKLDYILTEKNLSK